jgi:hypothetical protein
MTHPLQLALKRPVQQSYPHIDALYLLLRAAGLGRITGARNQQRLAPDSESLESWWQLNPTERYFTLLETWLLRARLDILGHRIGGFQIPIAKWHRFFQDLSKQGGRIAGERRVEQSLPYNPGLLVVAMLELFGFMTIEHGTPSPGKGWTLVEVQPTPWGETMLHLLIEKLMDFDSLFEVSHWFDQCDLHSFERSGSRVLLEWLDEPTPGALHVANLSEPGAFPLGLQVSCGVRA